MKLIEDNFKKKIKEKTYIALGNFDGLHLGHMSLIEKAKSLAKENNCSSMVYFFNNHPLTIINSKIAPKLLTNNETKIEILRESGIDIVNMVDFNQSFMKINPKDFILKLLHYYNAKGFIVGFNYRYGFKNQGDIDLLDKLSISHNFHLEVMKPVCINDEVVSSSKIRKNIAEGNIELTNKMLSRPYMITGNVIKGRQIGRTIGFPTINLGYMKDYAIPKRGVYYTIVEYDNIKYDGITNIGFNPTVQGEKLSIETHLLNFNSDIYNENVKIYFIKRIRDEIKFENLEALKNQIEKDKFFVLNGKFKFTF